MEYILLFLRSNWSLYFKKDPFPINETIVYSFSVCLKRKILTYCLFNLLIVFILWFQYEYIFLYIIKKIVQWHSQIPSIYFNIKFFSIPYPVWFHLNSSFFSKNQDIGNSSIYQLIPTPHLLPFCSPFITLLLAFYTNITKKFTFNLHNTS